MPHNGLLCCVARATSGAKLVDVADPRQQTTLAREFILKSLDKVALPEGDQLGPHGVVQKSRSLGEPIGIAGGRADHPLPSRRHWSVSVDVVAHPSDQMLYPTLCEVKVYSKQKLTLSEHRSVAEFHRSSGDAGVRAPGFANALNAQPLPMRLARRRVGEATRPCARSLNPRQGVRCVGLGLGPWGHSGRRRGSGFSGPTCASSSGVHRSRTSSTISDSA